MLILTATCEEVWSNVACETFHIVMWHHKCIFTMLFQSMKLELAPCFKVCIMNHMKTLGLSCKLAVYYKLNNYEPILFVFVTLKHVQIALSVISSMFGWVIRAYNSTCN